MSKKRRVIPYHPVLIGWIIPMGLYAANRHLISFNEIIATFLVMLVISLGVFGLGRWITKDWKKGAIWASILIVLLTFFGKYLDLFGGVKIPFIMRPIRMDHNFYLWSSLVIMVFTTYKLRKSIGSYTNPTKILNLVSVAFFLSSVALSADDSPAHKANISSDPIPVNVSDTSSLPDIYYLVVDAYGRADVLDELYNFDNGSFISYLKDEGFFVAENSNSNYGQTVLSLPSALNMQYADTIASEVGVESEDRKPLKDWYISNRTFATLKKLGYQIIATDAPVFNLVTIKEASDIYYETPGTDLNLYENKFINSTVLRAFNKRKKVSFMDQYSFHRKKILHAFDRIKETTELEGRKFVHGHVLSPHQPFVFDKDGNPVDPEYEYTIWKPMETGRIEAKYKRDYIGQLQFINSKLKETIDHIKSNAKRPFVIIVQGDHGPASEVLNINGLENNNFKERMAILNAYYFPDGNYEALSDTISPINSFRVVFDEFFGASLPNTSNRAMYSSWLRPYMFFDVTDSVRIKIDSISVDTAQ